MNRQDLEQQALERVCSCWYYDLADTVGEAADTDLQKIIDYPAWSHMQNQINNPVSGDEFIAELAHCPDTDIKETV